MLEVAVESMFTLNECLVKDLVSKPVVSLAAQVEWVPPVVVVDILAVGGRGELGAESARGTLERTTVDEESILTGLASHTGILGSWVDPLNVGEVDVIRVKWVGLDRQDLSAKVGIEDVDQRVEIVGSVTNERVEVGAATDLEKADNENGTLGASGKAVARDCGDSSDIISDQLSQEYLGSELRCGVLDKLVGANERNEQSSLRSRLAIRRPVGVDLLLEARDDDWWVGWQGRSGRTGIRVQASADVSVAFDLGRITIDQVRGQEILVHLNPPDVTVADGANHVVVLGWIGIEAASNIVDVTHVRIVVAKNHKLCDICVVQLKPCLNSCAVAKEHGSKQKARK